ncbi:capsule assembly Wzi family protein [Catalinimonas alkaloidigena]|uniref:capsule assembly Wzi family protein n=1 Tax=Catalinimonas alkaloidigena TaxID=1075417 RepID=UPI0024049496|nr:capsule assembly Wzi family protein [Catalinimonas alkaloidigena]
MKYGIGTQATYTSSERVPFWMAANQYGSIPLSGPSLSVLGHLSREYDSAQSKLVDWGFSLEGRANLGEQAEFLLIEGYVKGRLGIFEFKAGREKNIVGLVDSTLSSGSYAVSGNALSIPKIELSVPEFYALPLWGGLFAFKGNFVHGWLGDVRVRYPNAPKRVNSFIHQKSFFGRIGRSDSKLKLYGGINHVVYWGNDKNIYGKDLVIPSKKVLLYVFTGKNVVGSWSVSKVGNHLGSIDVGLDYTFDKLRLMLYRQNFYDKGAIGYLANLYDGLNGISLSNMQTIAEGLQWKKFLLEVLYSKNQAGEIWSKWTPSGPEHYYNHKVYAEGYSYQGRSMGTPFFTPAHEAREGQSHDLSDYFINNRVLLFHLGATASSLQWSFTGKLSYSRNFGTFETSDVPYFWFNGPRIPHTPEYGIFEEVGQFSAYFEGERKLNKGLSVGYEAALDVGNLYEHAFGAMVKVNKTFH